MALSGIEGLSGAANVGDRIAVAGMDGLKLETCVKDRRSKAGKAERGFMGLVLPGFGQERQAWKPEE